MRGRNYRTPKRQVYSSREYIHGVPNPKISKFTMGDTKATYKYRVSLKAQSLVQIRHNALEAARIAVNKVLLDRLGETGYLIQVRVYPHVVLRENRMIATAGADRLQEGMRRAFGKPTGLAAVVRRDQPIIDVYVNDPALDYAKEALRVSASKIPTSCRIESAQIGKYPTEGNAT